MCAHTPPWVSPHGPTALLLAEGPFLICGPEDDILAVLSGGAVELMGEAPSVRLPE